MPDHDTLFPPGATTRDWVNDVLLTAFLILLSVVSVLPDLLFSRSADYAVQLAVAVVMVVPLVLRRHSPLLAMSAMTLTGLLHLVTIDGPTPGLFAVPVVAYSVARWVPGPRARAVIVVGLIASFLGPLSWFGPFGGNLMLLVLLWGACVGAVVTPYAVGRRILELSESRQREIVAAEQHYELLLAEREQQAQLAEASTRAMIARELHDIVAHSLSVMIVQAEGGRAVATRKPEAAVEALDTIAETGREALHEMRRIVGVLRGSPGRQAGRADYAPAPRLADIGDLVARTSDRARLSVHGSPGPTSPALELTVYRVVQEALTNFLKHAGPDAHAWVTLAYHPQRITVDVLDDGQGVADPTDGGGNGLRGMYERVTSMGGSLHAGTRPDRPGFRVTAVLPVRDARGGPRAAVGSVAGSAAPASPWARPVDGPADHPADRPPDPAAPAPATDPAPDPAGTSPPASEGAPR